MNNARFPDRVTAGRMLAKRLTQYASRGDVLVLGLPRGGVVVAAEVAHALRAPLDIYLVRKLGVPGHEEFAFGAIASSGVCILNDDTVHRLRITRATIAKVAEREQRELSRRERAYRGCCPALEPTGKIVIIVDDGIATGATMAAAVAALRQFKPKRLVVAAPTAAASVADEFRSKADEVVTLITPVDFSSVGEWYENFDQTTDADVVALIDRAQAGR